MTQANEARLLHYIGKALVGLALVALSVAILAASFALHKALLCPEALPLVGYGCQGASGAIYAREESDFPPCQRIERL